MKKIMFNDKFNLTELTLSGKKTRTTRIPKKLLCLDDLVRCGHDRFEIWRNKLRCFKGDSFVEIKLPYEIGEVVAVAQPYKDALHAERCYGNLYQCDGVWHSTKQAGFKNKMFVKAELMPERIRITDMKVEKLQNISEEDCLKEGIVKVNIWESHDLDGNPEQRSLYQVGEMRLPTPRDAFSELIDRVSSKGVWTYNPYVLAVYYELVK